MAVGMLASDLAKWMEAHLWEPQAVGRRFKLLPWQRRLLAAYLDSENQTLAISMARGNGKSSFFSALLAANMVDGSPLAKDGFSALLLAGTSEQARVLLQQVILMLEDYPIGDRGSGWLFNNAVGLMRLGYRPSNRDARVRAANPRALHGVIPDLILMDEPAQYLASARESIWQVLQTSAGKGRDKQTKIVALGTRASEPTHFFSRLLGGDADYVMDFHAHENEPIDKVSTWKKANPSLTAFPHLRKQLKRESKAALESPIDEHAFRSLRLNQGTDVADAERLASVAEWRQAEDAASGVARGERLILGLDLGEQHSMTAATAYWTDTGRIESWAVFPSDPDLRVRARQAQVGDLYHQLHKRGELMVCGGKAPDYKAFAEMCLAKFGVPHLVVCDRYKHSIMHDAMVRAGVSLPTEYRNMSWHDAGEDIRLFRLALARGDLKPVPSLLIRSGLSVSHLKSDPQGNFKMVKLDRLGRFDAVAAMVLAVGAAERRGWRPTGGVKCVGLFGESEESKEAEVNVWGEAVET